MDPKAGECKDPNCDHSQHEGHDDVETCEHGKQAVLSEKDVRSLVKSRYEQNHRKYRNAFLLMHIKTKKMVEIRGVSSLHACKQIGWRPRHVKLLAEREVSDEEMDNGSE